MCASTNGTHTHKTKLKQLTYVRFKPKLIAINNETKTKPKKMAENFIYFNHRRVNDIFLKAMIICVKRIHEVSIIKRYISI